MSWVIAYYHAAVVDKAMRILIHYYSLTKTSLILLFTKNIENIRICHLSYE